MLGVTKKLSLLAAIALGVVCGGASAQHIDGPFPEPPAPVQGIVEGPLPLGAVVLDRPYDYDWWYGCSPTAAGMYFGWWDEHGYPDVFPGDHRDWVLGLDCPNYNPANFEDAHGVVATWAHHQSGQNQGYTYGSWRGHTPACLADFMLTEDGGTSRSEMEWGFENFAAWDDPETPENESHVFSAQTYYTDYGWDYEDYCAEIDAGRPVHLGLSYYSGGGHSILGLGYNNTGGKKNIYLHTTWNSGLVEWPWQDPYGWTVYGGTTMQPGTEPVPEFSGYFAVAHEYVGDLRVWIGAGDPASPDWEILVWDRQGDESVNLVRTNVDLTGGLDFLNGRWYLRVTDYGSGTMGYIEDFQLRLNGDRWFTDDVHVAIPSGGTSCAYIDLTPKMAYVDQEAPGPAHDGRTWDTAFLRIQEGVDAATSDGDVWVADGVYVENVVMGQGVAIYGGFLGAEPGGYETELDQRNWVENVATIDGNRSGSCIVMAVGAGVDGFTITNGTGTNVGGGIIRGGGIYCLNLGQSGIITNNRIVANSAANDGGGIELRLSSAIVSNNIFTDNTGYFGGGLSCVGDAPIVTNNTIVGNHATVYGGGLHCYDSETLVSNNIIAFNTAAHGGGIALNDGKPVVLRNNDFYGNTGGTFYNCGPGEGDIFDDPLLVDPGAGDYHLEDESPCIDAGFNDAPGLPDFDFEGDVRVINEVVDIGADESTGCWPTQAPDPEPYCGGALFGEPASGFPGWVWFSIPLDPSDCCEEGDCSDPNVVLGFACSGRLWYWDRYAKSAQVYKPPFMQWDLGVGSSYLLYLGSAVENPAYYGRGLGSSFEAKLGRQGWTWVGKPGTTDIGYVDFMDSVQVRYPVGGMIRTAGEDYAETPGNWLSWGWPFWDTYCQAARTFTPYLPFGNNTCHPWLGYRVWVRVGTATSEGDPDQVVLIWP